LQNKIIAENANKIIPNYLIRVQLFGCSYLGAVIWVQLFE
jgi:hypothetical protein